LWVETVIFALNASNSNNCERYSNNLLNIKDIDDMLKHRQ